MDAYKNAETAANEIHVLKEILASKNLEGVALLVLCDDADFVSQHITNFLWVTFTRTNPSHDMDGVGSSYTNKHWGCTGPLLIDARVKPHHAPILEILPETEKSIEKIFNKGGSMYGVLQ